MQGLEGGIREKQELNICLSGEGRYLPTRIQTGTRQTGQLSCAERCSSAFVTDVGRGGGSSESPVIVSARQGKAPR